MGTIRKDCLWCGASYTVFPSQNTPQRRTCSKSCARKLRLQETPLPSVQERLWGQVDRSCAHGCWLWTGVTTAGYGRLTLRGNKKILAHRLSYELRYGPIPNELWVLHRCDVRRCVRPEHLFLGTHQDNVTDMVRKGRHAKHVGSRHPRARLTEGFVVLIREARRRGASYSALARQYGVSKSTIASAARGKNWRHVTL